ncbi:hypothetical protein [Streptomyces vilmorinianum]|uniref:hypothetical protein n=1 Tax=Streptomyces vilmorinianum TaxID=3051092 RepID=UPI0010FBA5DA|nr:hypothetical protein [Streptomyces vilmorinianum]
MLGQALIANGIEVDEPDAYYLYKARTQMIWPYDDRGRMIGEDVWETDADTSEIVRLDAADVMTTQDAARLLEPLIKPLPDFDEYVLGASALLQRLVCHRPLPGTPANPVRARSYERRPPPAARAASPPNG